MRISLSTLQRAPEAVADAAGDLQDLAFIGFFQLAARFDRPATVLFDTVEAIDAGARALFGVPQRLLGTDAREESRVARVAAP
jgi:hypothetical protein